MTVQIKIPEIGESITEVQVGVWLKQVGDSVEVDEPLVEIESEKATVELPAPVSGKLAVVLAQTGETVNVGASIGEIEAGEVDTTKPRSAPKASQADASAVESRLMPAARRMMGQAGLGENDVTGSGPGGRVLKQDVQRIVTGRAAAQTGTASTTTTVAAGRTETTSRMSPLRRTVARRLLEAQESAALLTTFNEVDMSEVKALRVQHGNAFLERHGTKLGFMSFFVRASVEALIRIPQVNAHIRGDEVVYPNYCDVGIAVGGGKGLVVPVIRDAQQKGFAELEREIADYGARARDGKLSLEELEGGTFTITNGGIFGSLLSTPIVNPPQSAIMGMHAIQDRPVARDGQVVIRPMMYVALTYDHRLVDGREAVTFLKTIKEFVESPARALLDV
ncbi:MAG: 2-oxoglutarate dehydrogenase complex dihydrolipoyllysine-residue succinyltransferase [Deltaproteobacteria bacterium]|nr:2-oxoglutarate dehydrogenase complex dihydrolipoyllysine-residue succinyltransferase [Deltaproteobacteria bacterium]